MKFYVGYRSFGPHTMEVFKSKKTPTYASHWRRYLAVIGPFRTKRGAEFMVKHGEGNPHCRCVSEAEALAKKYARKEDGREYHNVVAPEGRNRPR